MRKKVVLSVLAFFLFVCACQKPAAQTDEEPTPIESGHSTATIAPENTTTPAPTATPIVNPTSTPIVLPTATPEAEPTKLVVQYEPVLIDREHFGTERFCAYIKKNIDGNQDGFLSAEEGNAVTEINLTDFYYEKENQDEPEGTAIGFFYFPNLTHLGFVSPDALIIKNHPSLTHYGLGEAKTKDTYIEDCPKLASIFYSNAYGNLHVSDCEALTEFYANDGTNEILEFRNTPNLSVKADGFSKLVLDADAAISIGGVKLSPYGIENIRQEENRLHFSYQKFSQTREVTFEETNPTIFDISEGFPVRYVDAEEVACFSYEIFEMPEDVYDENGNKGYYVCITTKGDELRKESLPFYSPEYPDTARLFARPGQIEELSVFSYSPNKGVYIEVRWNFLIGYAGEDGEVILGSTGAKTQRWRIDVDGTAKQE